MAIASDAPPVVQGDGESYLDYIRRKWAVLTGQPYDYGEVFGPPMPDDGFFDDQKQHKMMLAAAALLLATGVLYWVAFRH